MIKQTHNEWLSEMTKRFDPKIQLLSFVLHAEKYQLFVIILTLVGSQEMHRNNVLVE
jgi:hypothetical protein